MSFFAPRLDHDHIKDDYADICIVPVRSPILGGGLTVYGFDINQPSLPPPFYTVLLSISIFMVLSNIIFHFIYSPNNSLLSYSVLPVLFLPYWSFQPYISL